MSLVAVLPLHNERDIFCLIDAADYAWAKQWLWNIGWFYHRRDRIYAKRNIGKRRLTVWLHREIMKRKEPATAEFYKEHVVDHINNLSLDNRTENLRWATRGANNLHFEYDYDLDIFKLRAQLEQEGRLLGGHRGAAVASAAHDKRKAA